eukprot:11448697-Prorocentrum_lima.AAC.1
MVLRCDNEWGVPQRVFGLTPIACDSLTVPEAAPCMLGEDLVKVVLRYDSEFQFPGVSSA